MLIPGQAERAKRAPVKARFAATIPVRPVSRAGDFERTLNRFRAAVAEEIAVQVAGENFAQDAVKIGRACRCRKSPAA